MNDIVLCWKMFIMTENTITICHKNNFIHDYLHIDVISSFDCRQNLNKFHTWVKFSFSEFFLRVLIIFQAWFLVRKCCVLKQAALYLMIFSDANEKFEKKFWEKAANGGSSEIQWSPAGTIKISSRVELNWRQKVSKIISIFHPIPQQTFEFLKLRHKNLLF